MAQQERMSLVYRRFFVGTLGVVSVLLIVLALYRLRDVALIVACAGFLAYFLAWPIEGLLRRGTPRPVAIRVVCYSFSLVVLGVLGPIGGLIYYQAHTFVKALPAMLSNVETGLRDYKFALITGQEFRPAEYLDQLIAQLQQSVPGIMSNLLNYTQSFVTGTATVMVALIVIPLLALYFLLDSARLRKALVGCFPSRMHDDMERALTAINHSLSGYIYSKTAMALFVGIAMFAVLAICGVPFSILLGILAGLGEFVPVIGAWVSFVPIALVALTTGPVALVWVIILSSVVQLIQNYLVAPKLMSERMDLHPLTVVLAMMVGGTLAGIGGLILALPAAAAGKVLLNVFVFRRQEPGIPVPALDLISDEDGSADFRELPPEA